MNFRSSVFSVFILSIILTAATASAAPFASPFASPFATVEFIGAEVTPIASIDVSKTFANKQKYSLREILFVAAAKGIEGATIRFHSFAKNHELTAVNGFGKFVETTGVDTHIVTTKSYGWCFALNGIESQRGIGEIVLQKNDVVTFYYGYLENINGEWLPGCKPVADIDIEYAEIENHQPNNSVQPVK